MNARQLLLVFLAFFPASLDAAAKFDFGLIGDIPYDDQQVTHQFPNLIAELNRAKLSFVVHDGDIKSGSSPCTDALFQARYEQLQTSRHPMVLVFGDNEWSDCGTVTNQPFQPAERLEKLRQIFARDTYSLGRRKLKLVRQSDGPDRSQALFRENVRWSQGGVVFAGLNVPGPDNHFGRPEYGPRNAANLAWIRESFDMARQQKSRGLMLIIQANPHFDLPSTNRLRLGFNDMLNLLERETIDFQRPVVLVHGDSHYFRIDQPMVGKQSKRRLENFTRVETFGNPDAHWIRVTVDSRDPQVFRFRPEYVAGNRVKQ